MYGHRRLDSLDVPTILTTLALALIGVVSIASSTAGDGGRAGLWRMQLFWLVIAVVAAAVVVIVDYRVWAEISLALHGVVIVLLVLTLFVGTEIGGNRSWLVLGPARLQASEFAKWTTCLALAGYLASQVRGSIGLRQLVEIGLIAGVPAGLIQLQGDSGTMLTLTPIVLAALLIGGMRARLIVGLAVVGLLLAPLVWTQLEPYQKERVLTTFDSERDPSGFGYQVRQSKIAIGSGGITGQGLFRGTQNRFDFLPEQHTDFVLAVFAEENGFVGATILLGLFYYLFWRGIKAARSAQDRLGTYIALLVVAWLAGQMTINVGMVLGRLPTIGVPLPFMSYGGSSLLAAVCGVGLIVNVRTRRFVN